MATPKSSPRTPLSPPRRRNSKSFSWDAEVDTNAMFTNHTVEEIQEIEKKTRNDIEKKKEDLRLMVGERYRDLIDAADTITEMKVCAKEVMGCVQDVKQQCKDLQQSHKCYGVGGKPTISQTDNGASQVKSGFYPIASQMKLLVDTPEKIWAALEAIQYLKATRLYLFSHYIVSVLHLESGHSGAAPKVLSSFPILPKQWSAISHFKDSILKGSRTLLKDATQSEEMLAESLCSVLLLEESSPRQVFTEFLLARKSALQEIFHPSQHATSIKSQVCEVVKLIRTTLFQIHALFYGGEDSQPTMELKENPSLVFQTLDKVTSRSSEEKNSDEEVLESLFGPDFDLVTSARFLPSSVLGYRPHLRAFPSVITTKVIQNNCSEWIAMCVKDISSGVSKLLKYIGSLKGLAAIRDAVWDLIREAEENKQEQELCTAMAGDWQTLCSRVVGRQLSLWDEFLRPLFTERAKAILQGLFDATVSSCKNLISKTEDDFSDPHITDNSTLWERDIAEYIWHESPNDVPAASLLGTRSIDNGVRVPEAGGLAFKARACTPAVQRFCASLDSKLQATIEDSKFFVSEENEKNIGHSRVSSLGTRNDLGFLADNKSDHESKGPFERFCDAEEIQTFLQETCFDHINQLLKYIDDILIKHKDQLNISYKNTAPSAFDTTPVDRVLFLGRICQAVPEQCANLKLIMQGSFVENKTKTPGRITRNASISRRKTEQKDNPKMAELNKLMKETYNSSFRLWRNWITALFLSSFESSVLCSPKDTALFCITSWEEIEIEEETEAGKKVKSTIRVPMQVSSFVMSLLFSLCQELNRIGGHAVDRSLLKELVQGLCDGVLDIYEKLIKLNSAVITQRRALQNIFDIKFIFSILCGRPDSGEVSDSFAKRQEKIIDSLEGFVDPFDLDVFSPYMSVNLNKHLQKCGVLFGILVSLDKNASHSFGVTHRSTAGSHDQHNIMALAPNPPRFTLLPLTVHVASLSGHTEGLDHSRRASFKNPASRETEKNMKTSKSNQTAFHKHHELFTLNQAGRRRAELKA